MPLYVSICVGTLILFGLRYQHEISDAKDSLASLEFRSPTIQVPTALSGGHVLISASVNSVGPSWFLLDSGSNSDLISTELAAAAKLRGAGSTETRRGSGMEGGARYQGAIFVFEGGSYKPGFLLAGNAPQLTSYEREPVMGILGHDFFGCSTVEIDYANRSVKLHLDYTADPQLKALEISFASGLPIVIGRMMLPGGVDIEARFLVDTGSSGAVHLSQEMISKHLLEDSLIPRFARATSLRGSVDVPGLRLPSLQLGTFLLHDVPAVITEKLPHFDAIIGGEILSRFTIIFDYKHHRLFLRPNELFNARFRGRNASME